MRNLTGIVAALVALCLMTDAALACACCSNRGFRYVAIEKTSELRLREIASMTFDEDAALAEYVLAAGKLLLTGGPLAAGELMLEKAKRTDLAREHFRAGWRLRPAAGAFACALHLARIGADAGDGPALRTLLDEADVFLRHPGNDAHAAEFYNLVAALAERPPVADFRDELRDRALVGLAGKLRQRAAFEERPGDVVAQLLGQKRAWAPPVVSDADFAFRAALSRSRRDPRPSADLRLGTGVVTAACYAPESGDVIVGFAAGDVVSFRPALGSFGVLAQGGRPVISLATDPSAGLVVVLRAPYSGAAELGSYVKDGPTYVLGQTRPVHLSEGAWLTPRGRPPTPACGTATVSSCCPARSWSRSAGCTTGRRRGWRCCKRRPGASRPPSSPLNRAGRSTTGRRGVSKRRSAGRRRSRPGARWRPRRWPGSPARRPTWSWPASAPTALSSGPSCTSARTTSASPARASPPRTAISPPPSSAPVWWPPSARGASIGCAPAAASLPGRRCG